MRKFTPLLLMAALTATASKPEKMFVVIHTTDKVIVNYVCVDKINNEADNPVLGSYIKSTGGYNWHVVGGVAPYTIVKNEMRSMNSGCITVMDAEGTIATSCGIVGVRQERQEIDCQRKDDKLDYGPYGLVPNDSTDKARVGWKTKPGSTLPVRPTEDVYVPPVKEPLGDVDPVGPRTPLTTKKTQHRTPSTGTSDPTPVNKKAVHPVSPSKEVGNEKGPKDGATQSGPSFGQSEARPHVLFPNKVR